MFRLLKNGDVYAPEHIGKADILICNDKIVDIAEHIDFDYPGTEVVDLEGRKVIPGVIDQHIHVTGGGGESGFTSKVTEVGLSDLVRGGVCTVVGVLGTDSISRNVESLLAKVKALNEEGLTAYCYTGSYDYPSPTVTGSVGRDIALIDEVIGVKEGADVSVHGSFDSIVDGLVLTARIEAPVAAECTRCLKPIKRDWGVDVVAFFPYEESAKARSHGKLKNEDVEIVAGEDESEDVYPLSRDGAFADLEALLRDTLVEALPLQPLCREDCRGLCSQCGVDLNEHPDHHHDVTDLRFAALAGLKAQLEAEEHGDK